MNEQDELSILGAEEDDAMLPDGYAEGDDFFDVASWTGGAQTDEPVEPTAAETGTNAEEEGAEGAPTTEQPEETDGQSAGEEEAEEGPGQDPVPVEPPRKLKFKAKVDREERDVELDEAELPSIYQKAQITDRAQQRLAQYRDFSTKAEATAKALGFESAEEMLQKAEENYLDAKVNELVDAGTPKEIAEDYVRRLMGTRSSASGASEPEQEPAPAQTAEPPASRQETPPSRDFRGEATRFFAEHPEWVGKQLPAEVSTAWAAGKSLEEAFGAYTAKQKSAEASALRKENRILKQNAAAAAKAPVKGVTGGGETDTQPIDPFIAGFDSDEW